MTKDNINIPLVTRLKLQMLRKGLNPKTLAEKANVGRSFVYDILNGKSSNPTSSKLIAIAEQLGVSVQYLLSGVHQNLEGKQKEWSDLVEIASISIEETPQGSILVTSESDAKPYLFGNEWIKNNLKSKPEDIRSINVVGDTMTPTFQEGDKLLINIALTTANPPGIFVVFDGVSLLVKRLEMISKEKIRLLSDNPRYAPYERDLAEVNIVGKVVWLAREI